jgi:hypothetical protein
MTALALTGDVRGLDAHLVGAVRASELLDGLHGTHHARIKPQLLHSHESALLYSRSGTTTKAISFTCKATPGVSTATSTRHI